MLAGACLVLPVAVVPQNPYSDDESRSFSSFGIQHDTTTLLLHPEAVVLVAHRGVLPCLKLQQDVYVQIYIYIYTNLIL